MMMKSVLLNILERSRHRLFLFFPFFFITVIVSAQYTDTTTVGEEIKVEEEREYYHFNLIYGDEEPDSIVLREVPHTVIKSLRNDKEFWYADSSFKTNSTRANEVSANKYGDSTTTENREVENPRDSYTRSRWLSTPVLVIILVIFMSGIIFYLMKNNIMGKRPISSGDENVDEESENIFGINYQKEIDKAIGEQNYRLAIRLMFLRLLKNLSEKNIIHYKQERTNFDYLSQLHTTGYYNDFFRLTRDYEYAWYGKFHVSPETFDIIKNDFEKFDNRLS